MCGIAGFISAHVAPDERRAAVERMNAAMLHRGPDDVGLFTADQDATLGMRRLAIFDPAHGHQPMSTADGRFHLVFNGAIYNFQSLRTELSTTGIVFKTHCDTEVLLQAFAAWGEACLDRLRGMFAFAVWDQQARSLFFARDPLGIKPLYYFAAHHGLLLASEVRALRASGHCKTEIDTAALSAGLAYLSVPAPRTLYHGVRSLRPGESATFKDGKLTVKTYWSFRHAAAANETPCSQREEFIPELRRRLADTIRAHSLADVPVGAFLSGGLDSSAVVGLMAHHGQGKLKTFSVGFGESEYSEADEAAASARHFGTEHTPFLLTGERVAADLDDLLASYDQPTGDGVNTYYVSRAARAGGVTVSLSGLGGDELFGGYPWFRTTPRLTHWLPYWRLVPGPLKALILRRLEQGDARRQKLSDFLRHARTLHQVASLQRRNFSESARRSLLNTDVAYSPHDELASLTAEVADANPFEVVSAWELRTYMADVLLRDSDVMSMRHSLELRVPFVDRPLIEWLWRQPARFKNDPVQPKSALAEAVRDLLPPGLVTRKKRGFTLPFALWMRSSLRPFLDETFSSSSLRRSGLFNSPEVQKRWQSFLAGNDVREWSRLWTLAVMVVFINRRASCPA
jgi:asparagine synthase (glutamine-hydrolysing)